MLAQFGPVIDHPFRSQQDREATRLIEERQVIDSMNASVRNLGLIAEDIPRDQTAIIDLSEFRPRLLSYGDFRMSVHAVARGLVSHGVERGDRIGVLSLNRAEYLIILFGAALAGAVAVPLNVKLPADTLRELLRVDAARPIFAEHNSPTWRRKGRP